MVGFGLFQVWLKTGLWEADLDAGSDFKCIQNLGRLGSISVQHYLFTSLMEVFY